MRVMRRVVFPVLWLLIFGVIAAALVKVAFIDGLKTEGEQPVPQAQVQSPVVEAGRGTVTNTVELAGTVQSDAAVPVRVTASGKVVYFFLEKGAQVAAGERIFQIRSEVAPDPADLAATGTSEDADPKAPARAPVVPQPVFAFTDVLAPADGTLDTLTVLLNQEVSVGDNAGTVAPGSFSITGSLNVAQQFRLMGKPTTAVGSVTNGPAPFDCSNVQLSNTAPGSGGGSGEQTPPDAVGGAQSDGGTGQVRCAVPAGTAVFPGLGATITLTAGESKDVLTLPLTAVKGSVQNGVVWVPAVDGNGAPEERKVVLGLNDGTKVEISSGLSDGEKVLEFVPGVDAVLPGGPVQAFPGMGG